MHHKYSYLRFLKDFFPYMWKEQEMHIRLRFILVLFFLIMAKVIITLVPILFKLIIDKLYAPTLEVSPVIYILITYILFRTLAPICDEIKEVIFSKIEHLSIQKFIIKFFKHLYNLSISYYINQKTGNISNIIQLGIKAIEILLKFFTFSFLPIFFEIFFIFYILFAYYPIYYGIIIMVMLTLYFIHTIACSSPCTAITHKMNNANHNVIAKVVDSFLNYETVKCFANEKKEINQLDVLLKEYGDSSIELKKILSLEIIGQNIILSLGLGAVLIIAIHQINQGLTMGDFILLHAYILQLCQPLKDFGKAYTKARISIIEISCMFDILKKIPQVQDKEHFKLLENKEIKLKFSNVSFSYNNHKNVLNNISFTVPNGESVAIVGSSGGGKSTISKLICRFYDVDDGEISINGINIKDIKQKFLRRMIGIVPQDTLLFNNTILYNIQYGNFSATIEEVIQAAKMAQIHDFIMRLPSQYNTIVGERGINLSGGEKQRLAIARVLLKNPSILVFDEATSALDVKTEQAIHKTLKQISRGKTTLIIAHRLSTVVDADNIIVLEGGNIVESGTHNSLLKLNKVYSKMWHQQKR